MLRNKNFSVVCFYVRNNNWWTVLIYLILYWRSIVVINLSIWSAFPSCCSKSFLALFIPIPLDSVVPCIKHFTLSWTLSRTKKPPHTFWIDFHLYKAHIPLFLWNRFLSGEFLVMLICCYNPLLNSVERRFRLNFANSMYPDLFLSHFLTSAYGLCHRDSGLSNLFFDLQKIFVIAVISSLSCSNSPLPGQRWLNVLVFARCLGIFFST